MYAALPHAEVGLLQVGDLDATVTAVVIPVGLEAVVPVGVSLALAAVHVSSLLDAYFKIVHSTLRVAITEP